MKGSRNERRATGGTLNRHPEDDMARVSTYLNFPRSTEEAFNFYRSVFGTEFIGGVMRFADVPAQPGQPPLSEADKALVMHIELPILAGHVLMGTDAPESMGFTLINGNTVTINLEPDTRAQTDTLFSALAGGGKVDMPLTDMFWGSYFGILVDKFGIRWMFNCSAPA
jgi:PhnB protein